MSKHIKHIYKIALIEKQRLVKAMWLGVNNHYNYNGRSSAFISYYSVSER